jgi:hypothetical protein
MYILSLKAQMNNTHILHCVLYMGFPERGNGKLQKLSRFICLLRLRKTSGDKRENRRKAQFEGTGQGHASPKSGHS